VKLLQGLSEYCLLSEECNIFWKNLQWILVFGIFASCTPTPWPWHKVQRGLTYACYPRQPESSTSVLQKPEMDINLIMLWYATLSLHHHCTPHLVVDELQGCKNVLSIWGLNCNVISIMHHILWIASEWLLCLNYCVIIIVCVCGAIGCIIQPGGSWVGDPWFSWTIYFIVKVSYQWKNTYIVHYTRIYLLITDFQLAMIIGDCVSGWVFN
jgi:hypothetical protein